MSDPGERAKAAPAAGPGRPAVPALPRTWRPRRTRRVTLGVATLVLVVLGMMAIRMTAAGGTDMKVSDRLGVFGIGLFVASVLFKQSNVRAVADVDGLRVINLLRQHHFAWGEILAVTLRRGDPWVTIDLADGRTIAVMGIQASDGPTAPASARELAALVRRYGGDAAGT